MRTHPKPTLHGLVAEFNDPEDIVVAAERVTEAGYRHVDAYTPFPIHGLDEAIKFEDNRVPWTIFICGMLGCAFGYGLQCFVNMLDYPINIGGRPYQSWPSFIPVTFECTILFSAFGAVVGMLAMNGLPKPYHPIFNAPRFELASQDRFFLCIEATDPQFDREKTELFLESLHPQSVSAVEP
jgi:hypothetical protein